MKITGNYAACIGMASRAAKRIDRVLGKSSNKHILKTISEESKLTNFEIRSAMRLLRDLARDVLTEASLSVLIAKGGRMSVQVIAHRGWWKTPEEQNTLTAFARAFDAGIGVELDVRDFSGDLVVSHDPPVWRIGDNGDVLPPPVFFKEVLNLLGDRPNILAVNVKSCGLAPWFAKLKAPRNWFFFDMAEPDERHYRKLGLPVLDSGDEIDSADHTLRISEEIFGNPHRDHWGCLKDWGSSIYLITDLVSEAMEFFK